MRILLLHDYGVAVGGAEHLSLALRREYRARGHEARLLTSRAQPLEPAMTLPILADRTCYGSMGLARRFSQALNPSASAALAAELTEFRPDVVHVRMFMSQLSPLILRQLTHLPTLLHVVNYDLICPLNTRVLPDGSACRQRPGMACHRSGCLPVSGLARAAVQRWQWRRWQGAVNRIVCNSHRTQALLQTYGVPATQTIWNGVPETQARPLLPASAAPHLGFAGRLVPKKGVDWLLRAFAKVLMALPTARLSIAGDGPERQRLEALSESLGIASRICWLGHVSREALEAAFRDVWVQVVPSRWEEPFGLVAAEAMMRGCAVVGSRGGGLEEQIIDGTTGFVVTPDDVDGLAAALSSLLGDQVKSESFGRGGRERALRHFTEAAVAEQFLALYPQMIDSQGDHPPESPPVASTPGAAVPASVEVESSHATAARQKASAVDGRP